MDDDKGAVQDDPERGGLRSAPVDFLVKKTWELAMAEILPLRIPE